ncbi:MAG TPA: DUF192 domain-containing protein [Aequorivita sp.]|jgi:uncharacterized membrane protein (UPF0127 family)|nr:hypothetical protein [Aequorivita sp.]MBP41773.1 hypothetical protein [Aequorivita sp.]HNP69099.1 DUF192 domain-containing protein [Aequorivita sp.]|tara:strand:+ start:275 stop:772 length:498 start_codon:yes stop_codon:yes gene_type:complete
MKKVLFPAVIAASILSFYNCKDNTSSEEKNLTKEITFKKEGELQLLKAENDSIIASLDIEVADDEYQTQTGLMYRNSLGKDQGMLFVFNDMQRRSFYMKNTKIPLDIIYLNAEKEIVSIQKNAKPFDETSLPSEAASQYVLEVNAGLAEAWQLATGDRIRFSTTN